MKPLLVIIIIVIISVVGVLVYQNFGKKQSLPQAEIFMPEKKPLEGKTIAMVIAFRDFRDEEYFVPKAELEKAGAVISTVSSQKGMALGADGGQVNVDLETGEVNLDNFNAVLFIGGPGMAGQLDNVDFQKLAQETVAKNKVLAAICIAPVLLAKAGVLEGKKATVWSSSLDKSPVRMLEQGGANYEDKPIVVDGSIVTANGPAAAKKFSQAVIEALK